MLSACILVILMMTDNADGKRSEEKFRPNQNEFWSLADDGRIKKGAFTTLMKDEGFSEKCIQQAWKKYDRNRDGFLTNKEMRKTIKLRGCARRRG